MQQRQSPVRKVFVVGCPRSGTTIVQAQLAALPGVYSPGETHFFEHLLGHFDRWLFHHPRFGRATTRRMWLVSGRTHRRVNECFAEATRGDGAGAKLPRRLTGAGYTRCLVRRLDALARQSGHGAWVEKTPDHLAYIDIISRRVPDAVFLHVVRNGEDVVASAIEAQLRYRDRRAFSGGIDHWIARWNRAAEEHLRFAGHPRHVVLPYEGLLAAPDRVRELLAELCGLDPHPPDGPVPGVGRIADPHNEPWKQDALDGVVRAPPRKVEALFGPRLQRQLRALLGDYPGFLDELAQRQEDPRHRRIVLAARTLLARREDPAGRVSPAEVDHGPDQGSSTG